MFGLFVLKSHPSEQVVKVADFGVARVQTETGVMTAETGTYRWMAPEVCNFLCQLGFWCLYSLHHCKTQDRIGYSSTLSLSLRSFFHHS